MTVAHLSGIPRTAELEYEMLQMIHRMDRIKSEIDHDDDAAVCSDVTLRTLGTAELKGQVHQVAAPADGVYGAKQSHLTPQR